MRFDIKKPMPFQVGMYQLHKNPDYNFQLNRLINMDGADKKLVEKIAGYIHDNESWKSVLLIPILVQTIDKINRLIAAVGGVENGMISRQPKSLIWCWSLIHSRRIL